MKQLSIFILGMVLLSSCSSLTPFTQELYEDLGLTEEEVKQVQFYLSEDIVLYRETKRDQADIQNGKIRFEKGRKIHEVVLKKGTPGIVVFMPKEERFAVSFDGVDNKFLIFGPNTKLNEQYTLMGKEWSGRIGQVSYGGEIYETSTRNALTKLMVNVNKIRKVKVSREEPKGRRISD